MTSLFTQSGVYLCRHADVISKKPLLPGVPGYLIVFKVIKVCIQLSLSLSLSLFHIKKISVAFILMCDHRDAHFTLKIYTNMLISYQLVTLKMHFFT